MLTPSREGLVARHRTALMYDFFSAAVANFQFLRTFGDVHDVVCRDSRPSSKGRANTAVAMVASW